MGQTADELTHHNQTHITKSASSHSDDETPDQLHHDIEHTRSEMSDTINALQARLQPQHLVDEAKETIREATIGKAEDMVYQARDTARQAGNGIIDTIRENPIPAALAGIGLGWLFFRGRSRTQTIQQPQYYQPSRTQPYSRSGNGSSTAYYDERQTQQTGSSVQEKAGQLVGQTGDKLQALGSQAQGTAQAIGSQAQALGSQAQGTAQQVGGQAQYQAQRAKGWFEQNLNENPLVVGAAVLALGAIVGLAIPETEPEQHLMGETRDNLMEKAQTVAQDTVQKVQAAAQETLGAAKDAAQEAAKHQGLTGNSTTR